MSVLLSSNSHTDANCLVTCCLPAFEAENHCFASFNLVGEDSFLIQSRNAIKISVDVVSVIFNRMNMKLITARNGKKIECERATDG